MKNQISFKKNKNEKSFTKHEIKIVWESCQKHSKSKRLTENVLKLLTKT